MVSKKIKELHEFIWIVDKEATKDECGYEHEECTICGYKQNESLIEIGLPPITSETIYFTNGNDLEQYVLNNKINCLYFNKISAKNEILNCYNTFYRINFEKKGDKNINPCVEIYTSIYSDFLGYDTNLEDDVQLHSITFLFNFCEYEKISELRYEFYEYNDDKTIFNNLIYIYSDDKKVGEVLYYEVLDVSHEWITEFLNENIIY